MNAKCVTDGLDVYRFLRRFWQCEDEFGHRRGDEAELYKAIDAFSRLDLIPTEPEVLFCVSEGGLDVPPLVIVFYNLRYVEAQVCSKDEEIPIGF